MVREVEKDPFDMSGPVCQAMVPKGTREIMFAVLTKDRSDALTPPELKEQVANLRRLATISPRMSKGQSAPRSSEASDEHDTQHHRRLLLLGMRAEHSARCPALVSGAAVQLSSVIRHGLHRLHLSARRQSSMRTLRLPSQKGDLADE